MANFTELYNEYENTRNVCKFCSDHSTNQEATRFLLIRSLDKPNLIEILENKLGVSVSGKINELMSQVYDTDISIEELLHFIEGKRNALILAREQEIEGLSEMLSTFPVVNCGVRNDKVDDIVKALVRNKDIKTLNSLQSEMDNEIIPRIRQYILWSYYNQTSNDILELFFLRHPKVIPTLRKVHQIDFFVNLDDEIIPFDLKVTHISDSYFDLLAKGFIYSDGADNFVLQNGLEEIKEIKNFYISKKREYHLPNLGKLSKLEILDCLINTGENEARVFVEHIKTKRASLVDETERDLKKLEWWNYKFQGERLFSNNNRLFLFMAYKNQFIDGRSLKGKTEIIGNKITELLDNLTLDNIHTIKYHYDKDRSLIGDYVAKSISTIYTE